MLEKGERSPPEQGKHVLPTSLSGEINAATRTLHTTLNRLITSRLPLALPPHAHDPSLYTTGLVHFAHIFLTFESLWADLLRDHGTQTLSPDAEFASPPTSPLLSYLLVNPYDSPSFFTSTPGAPTPPSPQLLAFLQNVRPRGLLRSARIKRDLEHLMELHPTDLEVLLAKYPGDKVADFCTHIRKAVHEKPWTLVSYAWCFYMAVFSGGRWIRAELLKAGPDFWREDDKVSMSNLSTRRLSFWHFPGQSDGEDIKLEFKEHLASAETLFTSDQRVDIIEEAKNIFRLCASLVDELDEMLGKDCAEPHFQNKEPGRTKAESEKNVHETNAKHMMQTPTASKSSHRVVEFVRRPEVTSTLVALACLACLALFRLQ